MEKIKWKLIISVLLLITNLVKTSSHTKCASIIKIVPTLLTFLDVCDDPDLCECKSGSTKPSFCSFGNECAGCMGALTISFCTQYGGKTSPETKNDKAKMTSMNTVSSCPWDYQFSCGGKCKTKNLMKECSNGKCKARQEICEEPDEPCYVNHDLDAVDWKCGDKCRKEKPEVSTHFDCDGKCNSKRSWKVCGNGECIWRTTLCKDDDDKCEIRHEDGATDWQCGRVCRKDDKETSYKIGCGEKCEDKKNWKKCCNGKYMDETKCEDEDEEILESETSVRTTSIKTETSSKKTNSSISLKENNGNGNSFIIPVVIVSVIFLIIAISFSAIFLQKKKEKRKKSLDIKYLPGDIPEHRILEKNDDLLDTISQAAKEKTPNKEEFKDIQEYVRVNINEAKTIGMQEENKNRNRYHDILPYDSNMVNLKKPTGDPPLTYMSASMITFPDFGQNFIAIQAPKENMFSSFWQMILEQEISTIVMITGLVEGRKTKAHKYWPDMEDPDFELDNGCKLKYISHSFHGTYYQRQITLTDANGKERSIEQIQTTAWLDMTAPKDTKILLDLVYKARELAGDPNMKDKAKRKSISPKTKRSKRCPILVHCSAGVGRTGTFIALYKLVADYDNERVKMLDLFSTVVKMREQRMNMVQRYEQYLYIIKCLHHYIIAQTDIYQA